MSANLVFGAERFENVDHARHQLRELMQRWDNRLILENLSLAEAYLDGRIAILLIMEPSLGAGPNLSGLANDVAIGIGDTDNAENGPTGSGSRIVLLILADRDGSVHAFGEGGDQQAVLVHSVQTVKSEKQRVGSLVWFYIINQDSSQLGRSGLYKSVVTGSYKSLPRIVHREVDSGSFRVNAVSSKDLAGELVKGGAKIVNDITDDWSYVCGPSTIPNYKDMIASAVGATILVSASSVDVCLDNTVEPRFKLLDVLVGPFNL